jgi:hypothetical protein
MDGAINIKLIAPFSEVNMANMAEVSNLPMNEWSQHRYPRLRGYEVGSDGEVTSHLCLGLPCCGLDLLIEHPPTLTALELYRIAGEFAEMRERVKKLPSFLVCKV